MIIKLVGNETTNPIDHCLSLETFEVYSDVSHFSLDNIKSKMPDGSISFSQELRIFFKDDFRVFDLTQYRDVYIMNDEGKTVDKL